MAETVVSSVLQKLGDVVIQEMFFVSGFKDQVEYVMRELKWIHCFLKDADSKAQEGDSRVKIWVLEVKDVSYRIEDAIDTFLVDVWRLDQKEDGLRNILRRLLRKPMKLIYIHQLRKKMNIFKIKIRKISDNAKSYGIQNLGESIPVPVERSMGIVLPDIENDIIGFGDEKKQISELLLDQNVIERRVFSIVGQGGLGKTALAENIYNSADVKNHFDIRIWLTISQEFQPIQLLRDVLRKLRWWTSQSENDWDEAYFVGEIHKSLSKRKYLVVLDDIWDDYLWSDVLQIAFLDFNNGSRVLITTRFLNVARRAGPNGVHELRFLNNEESLELILEKAFPREDASKCYPPDLSKLAKEFIKHCGGLPLALVVVGGLLSRKPPTSGEWHKLLQNLNWQDQGNMCTKIIAMSYEELPPPLKSCFIYLASFPKDHKIRAKYLIQLWIADRELIPDEAGKILEEVALGFLEELAQRCMIQVSKRFVDGSIEHFHVHVLLHNIAIREAKEKNFLKVFHKLEDHATAATRAIFQLNDPCWEDISFEGKKLNKYIDPTKIGTLIFFGKVIPFNSQFKLLRVLVFKDCTFPGNGNRNWRNSLKRLFLLRCLVFKSCLFKHLVVLPVALLHNLQTLEISDSSGIEVPMSLWNIKTLRHVLANGETIIQIGLESTDVPNLQTLTFTVNKPGIELLNMPLLRELHLYNQSDSWDPIKALLLTKLNCIKTLTLGAHKIPLEIIDSIKAFPSYQNLQTLYLNGEWQLNNVIVKADIFPPNLTYLKLANSQIDEDLMRVLEKLTSLRVLSLFGEFKGKQMSSRSRGFPQLKELELSWIYNLEEWIIEKGALPVLTNLTISCCNKLGMLPDLQHVPTLNVLTLRCMPKKINLRLQNEDQYKIKHIRSKIIKND